MPYRLPALRRPRALATALTLASLGATAACARAQDAHPPPPRSLTGQIGLGVATLPTYTGSDEFRVVPLPIVQLEYKGRVYLGGSQTSVGAGVGAYVIRTASLAWDVGLAAGEPRPEERGDALAGMGKRSSATFVSSSVAYRLGFVSALAGVAVGLGKHEGTYGTVAVGGEFPLAARWLGSASAGFTLADARNMAFDFGVSPEQSLARRALRAAGDARLRDVDVGAFAPGAGLKEARVAASIAYLLTARSRVLLFTQTAALSAEAARSPLVRARLGTAAGLALTYGF